MRMGPAHVARDGGVCAAVAALRAEDDPAPLIEALRRHIARLEQDPVCFGRPRGRGAPWLTGVADVDRHLPAQGLARSGLHDVAPRAYGDQPAAMGLALALAMCRLAEAEERRPDRKSVV